MRVRVWAALMLAAAACDDDVPAPSLAAPALVWTVRMGPDVDLPVEGATLRAAALWEERTIGRVRFTFVRRTAPAWTRCEPGQLTVFDALDAIPGELDGVAKHEVAPWGCAYVAVDAGYRDTDAYRARFAAEEIDPMVAVLAHELGHVLGLPHAPSDERSIMGPSLAVWPVREPTCGDVATLGVVWATPIACRERAQ